MNKFDMFNLNPNVGGFPKLFHGKEDAEGAPVFDEVDRDQYIVPPQGDYTLAVTGFSAPRTVPSQFLDNEGNPKNQTVITTEIEIHSERGKGKRFIWDYVGLSLHEKAHLGKVYRAAVLNGAKDLPASPNLSDLFDHEFKASVGVSDKRDAQGRPIKAWVIADTARPAGGADEYDPFAVDDAKIA